MGSPEIYFGASRNEYLGNGAIGYVGSQNLAELSKINLNRLYLVGDWNMQPEYAENKSANAKIIFRYKAKNVYFVASAPRPIKVKIFVDGVSRGELIVQSDQLYNVLSDSAYGEHMLELRIEEPGLRAFTFTFG